MLERRMTQQHVGQLLGLTRRRHDLQPLLSAVTAPGRVHFCSTEKEVKIGIYVFHQGQSENGELWYSYFDFATSTWKPDAFLPNVGMSFSPSAVAYPGGVLRVFHHGRSQNGQLWFSPFNGENWEQDTFMPNVGITGSPSAVVFQGATYVFHLGLTSIGHELYQIWYSVFDGTKWEPDMQVPNIGNDIES
jgi:hypothetical protein